MLSPDLRADIGNMSIPKLVELHQAEIVNLKTYYTWNKLSYLLGTNSNNLQKQIKKQKAKSCQQH